MSRWTGVFVCLFAISSVGHADTRHAKLKRAEAEVKRIEADIAEACYLIKFYSQRLCGRDSCDEPLPALCRTKESK